MGLTKFVTIPNYATIESECRQTFILEIDPQPVTSRLTKFYSSFDMLPNIDNNTNLEEARPPSFENVKILRSDAM